MGVRSGVSIRFQPEAIRKFTDVPSRVIDKGVHTTAKMGLERGRIGVYRGTAEGNSPEGLRAEGQGAIDKKIDEP